MKKICRQTLLVAVSWSALVKGQTPPPPPPPLPVPVAPPSPPAPPPVPPALPPASEDVTSVRGPDTSGAHPAPENQGPDTLPSLDEEPTAVTPRAKKAAPVQRPPVPVRADRRIALLGELGWNGIAGFGAIVAYHANPHLTFELGAGLAAVGGKLGLRARYNFSTAPVTPFIGVAFIGATGYDAPTRDLNAEDNTELNIELKPAAFTQAVVGLDWTSPGGFTLVSALGYAWLVSGNNVVIITGTPTEDEQKGLDIVFGSGIVISIAIGYSFR